MDLSGTWCNQMLSSVILDDGGEGGLTGTIVCATGEFAGLEFPLVGSYDSAPSLSATAVAFVTGWANGTTSGHSVTAWSGQYDTDTDTDTIVAAWMLTTETGVGSADEWHSTRIGQDWFWRDMISVGPTILAGRRSSHPLRT